MTRHTDATDVVIVGGGPIGIELAVALKQAGVTYLHLEAGQIGSTFEWWAPETRFFSSPERIEIAGVPLTSPDQSKTTRERYLAYLRGVVRHYDLPIRTYERVVHVERIERIERDDRDDREEGGFVLHTRRSERGVGGPREAGLDPAAPSAPDAAARTIHARRIVFAIGNMHRPRRIDVPGEDLPHVSHYFDEPHRYFGQRVLIVGGKNSAVEAALRCYRCGCDVVMSYRGDVFDSRRVKYWLRPEIEWLIGKMRIEWHPGTVPLEILSDRVRLGAALPGAGDNDVTVRADFVLLLTGYVQDPTLFERLGCELTGEERSPLLDRSTMESSVPGVFVAGTATGGSQQRARIFLENSHVHVERIVKAITGSAPPFACGVEYANLEES